MVMDDETTPLLGAGDEEELAGLHRQYCTLVGLVPSDITAERRSKYPRPGPNTLYERARRKRRSTQLTHAFTTSLSNTLLLSQVMIGAALTALGAAQSSHVLIAVFGALNTVIAGLVAYLKSRGQPMRSRMFKDDLERVVDEIENSEIMWLGISRKMHGYDELDTDEVSVRSEVARLTRLYDRAIRNNTLNNPDNYMGGQGGGDSFANLRAHAGPVPAISAAVVPPVPAATATAPTADAAPVAAPTTAADESPVVKDHPSSPKVDGKPSKDSTPDAAGSDKSSAPVPAPADAQDASTVAPENKKAEGAKSGSQDAPATETKNTQPPTPVAVAPTEPPAGVPLGADVDEGPVTAPPKKKDSTNGNSGNK